MHNLSLLMAKVFNRTQNSYTFEHMLRVCVIGLVKNLVPLRQEKLEEFLTLLHRR